MTFEEWLATEKWKPEYFLEPFRSYFRAAWDAGAHAERERCAKLAEETFYEGRYWENVYQGGQDIAAAIRGDQ